LQRRVRLHLEPLEDRCVPSGTSPTAQDQLFLELLNNARANPAAYGNSIGLDLSSVAPSQPLAWDPNLITAATGHSQDMNANNFFSHYSSTGQDPGARITTAGYNWNTWGESIAAGYSDDASALQGLIIDAGVPDLGHRQQLLAMTSLYQSQTQVGIGVLLGGSGTYGNYWTIDSASPAASNYAFITGVVFNDAANTGQYAIGESLGNVTITIQGVGSTTTYDSGGYQFQVAPGTYTVTASGGGLVAPISQVVTIGTRNRRVEFIQSPAQASQATADQFVTNLYQSYLKRSPSATELSTFAGQLVNGRATQFSLTRMVQTSQEYAHVCTRWLEEAYPDILGRTIGSGEMTAWLVWLQQGNGTLNDVANGMLHSGEYQQHQWAGWVQSAYQTYLHRSAGAGEIAGWDGLFQTGLTKGNFIAAVIMSPEGQSHFTSNSQFVSALYTDLLGRTASTTEVQGWLNLLQTGTSRGAVVYGFLGSGEYHWHLAVSEAAQVYVGWLGRAAGASELAAWANLMTTGLSLEGFEAAVLGSAEYYARALARYGP
jgi:uncharacterized protein YkwD